MKKFFLNSNTRAHLRGLEAEFGESSNGIRIELNRFENAGLLISIVDGNKKIFQANKEHPLFNEIHSIILKETGIDKIIENVISRIGNLVCVYLTGDFACGKDGKTIDLILVGNNINREYLDEKVIQTEGLIGRKVKCQLLGSAEAGNYLNRYTPQDLLPLWNNGRKVEDIIF